MSQKLHPQLSRPPPPPPSPPAVTSPQALSFDNVARAAAEAQLRAWESDAAPGFVGSLVRVVAEASVPEVGGGAWEWGWGAPSAPVPSSGGLRTCHRLPLLNHPSACRMGA